MSAYPQHAQHAATIDAPKFVDRRGQAGGPRSPAPEWPNARCTMVGGVLGGLIWLAVIAWVLS